MDMHYLLKILYFCTEFPLNIFKSVLSIYAWIYFWSLYSLFMSTWHCFNQWHFNNICWNQSFYFVFLLKIFLAILGPVQFSIWILSSSLVLCPAPGTSSHTSVLCWICRGALCKSQTLPVSGSLQVSRIPFCEFWPPWPPALSALPPQLRASAWLPRASPRLSCGLGTLSRKEARTTIVLVGSLSSKGHCLSRVDVRSPENSCFTYFVHFFGFFR